MSKTTYISKEDYKNFIRSSRLDQILQSADEDEEAILDSAESEALALIAKHMPNYDMDLEYSKSGTARNEVILRWAKILVIYFIYARIPDDMCPERVVKDYDDTLKMLERIEGGKAGVKGLQPITQAAPGSGESVPATRRRWGSQPRRSNDGGSPRYLDR